MELRGLVFFLRCCRVGREKLLRGCFEEGDNLTTVSYSFCLERDVTRDEMFFAKYWGIWKAGRGVLGKMCFENLIWANFFKLMRFYLTSKYLVNWIVSVITLGPCFFLLELRWKRKKLVKIMIYHWWWPRIQNGSKVLGKIKLQIKIWVIYK